MERQRSPRSSIVPNIALNTESDSPDEVSIHPSYIFSIISLYIIYIFKSLLFLIYQ